jgi:hypothetical protein
MTGTDFQTIVREKDYCKIQVKKTLFDNTIPMSHVNITQLNNLISIT